MRRKTLITIGLVIVGTVLVAVFTIIQLVNLGMTPDKAAPVVGAIISAIAAAFSLRKELEVKQKESDLQVAETKLHTLETTTRESELEREQKARETYEAISAKCNAAPSLDDIDWKDAGFIEQIKSTDAVAKTLSVGARLIVVASGKGGVGKSTLSLGLVEAFSRFNNTLLVDFDMHNRGLTSLLRDATDTGRTNVLSEMERFHELYLQTELFGSGAEVERGAQLVNSFDDLRRRFSPPGTEMQIKEFAGKPVTPANEISPVYPQNAFFMPSTSTLPNERFLSSKVFRSQFDEVYFFLKCLSYWAGNHPHGFRTVILDCHGAHDHFMIGAIHAASALLVVTTPEPGAFDGTYDLLAFASVLRKVAPGDNKNFPTVLAVNNAEDWQAASVDAIKKFVQAPALDFVDSVTVPADEGVRQVTNTYEFGEVAKIPSLWSACSRIAATFENAWKKPVHRPPVAPPPPQMSQAVALDSSG